MEINPIVKKPVHIPAKKAGRGRPKGSKNKTKNLIRKAQRVNTAAAALDKDALTAALGLLLVAADLLRKAIN